MRIYDITMPLSPELPFYPGDFPVAIAPWTRVADGDSANVSRLTLCTHSGTHLDPPRHYSDQGVSVDEIPLGLLVGPAQVVGIPGGPLIGRRELERLPLRGVERLVLKTDNSKLWNQRGFRCDFQSLTVEAAVYLVEVGVKLVGIDYLSIESVAGDGEVHRTLLGNGVLILEGLNLADVEPGAYELICLPLKVKGGDGAPVRALLRGGAGRNGGLRFDPHTTRWPLA